MPYLKYFEDKEKGIVVVSMGPGDLFLESIAEVARKADIHTGVVICGLGALKKVHVEEGPNIRELEGFFQLFGFTGNIASYTPHIHITILNNSSGEIMGGHLKEGSVVGSIVELAIQRLPGLKLVSDFRDGSDVKLLCEAKE